MAEKAGGDALYTPPASSRKRSRRSKVAVKHEDHFSPLPDDVILHIFSFLEIKDVVNTRMLSRRWSSLWTRTLDISIDFVSEEDYFFLEWFVLRCKSPAIRQFHLLHLDYCMVGTIDSEKGINRWIRFAIRRNVKDLFIDLYKDNCDDYVLPRALLRCKSMELLKLRACVFPRLRNGNFVGVSWRSLKALCFLEMEIVDGVINGILEGSPLLESVTLIACYGMNTIRSFSRNMRELVIKRHLDPYYMFRNEHEEETRHRHNLRLEICIPHLRSLQLLGRWEGKEVVVLKEVSSLVEVKLNFSLVSGGMNSDIIHGTMKGILSKLSFVDRFILGSRFLVELHNYKGNGEQLNCRHLTIMTTTDRYSLGQIARALEIAPNVEMLVIDIVPKKHLVQANLTIDLNDDSLFENEIRNGKSWKSWTSRMKNIVITGFPACEDHEPTYWLSLIKALLRDTHALEEMVINVKWSWKHSLEEAQEQDVLNVAEDILGFPRGSKAAKIILKCPGMQPLVASS